MKEKKLKWYKIADTVNAIDWQTNNLATAEAGGRKITLAKVDGQVFACSDKCPHASGFLADGFIDASGSIVCPLHRYRFNLQNGRNVSGEGYYLKVFPVEERQAGVFVGFEENSLLDMLQFR
jgi:nitrite reductase/ring-hydroxylating ferredoxin subunit